MSLGVIRDDNTIRLIGVRGSGKSGRNLKLLAERALQAEEARIEHERLAAAPIDISKNDKKNEEGYFDMTAYKAMADKPTANENERFRKLLHTIFHLCELAGFELVGRITVRDRKTNRIWK